MKKICSTALLLGAASLASAAVGVSSFSDIEYWVGTGSNQSGLTIDFNDGEGTRTSFTWGYNWDGEVSGAQMIVDVANADSNLTITYGGSTQDGFFLSSVTYYDSVTGITHSITNGSESPYPYWGYFIVGGTAGDDFADPKVPVTSPATETYPDSLDWVSSDYGAGEYSYGTYGRYLEDNAWDAWAYGEWGATTVSGISYAAAVPEPGTYALFTGLFLLGCVVVRRRR